MPRVARYAFVAFAFFVFIPIVSAQQKTDFIPDDIKLKTAKKSGWFPALKAGFNFSFAQSDSVVGIPDGTTLNFGVQLEGSLLFSSGQHEWRNSLKLVHTQTKIPAIKLFLKSADRLDLESIYTYRFKSPKWLGLFIGLKSNTALLAGYLVKDTDTDLLLKTTTGKVIERKALKDTQFPLTSAFSPFFLKESAGLSMLPYDKTHMKVDLKLGGGAVQVFTGSSDDENALIGFVLADDAATPKLELTQLQDYVQAGVELQVGVTGVLLSKSLSYSILAEVMLPLFSSVTNNLSTIELINVEIAAKLSIKLASWASLNYSLSVVRAPLIVADWQIVNNLMLSITANLI